jgi:hypothetical protein
MLVKRVRRREHSGVLWIPVERTYAETFYFMVSEVNRCPYSSALNTPLHPALVVPHFTLLSRPPPLSSRRPLRQESGIPTRVLNVL